MNSKANEKACAAPSRPSSTDVTTSCRAKRSERSDPAAVEGPCASLRHLRRVREFDQVASDSRLSQLDLSRVQKAIDAFESAGKNLNESLTRKLASGKIDPQLAPTLNHGMMQVERNWLNPDGIPGRPWFKHILYGARFTYAHLELPGLTEAVEDQDWPTAKQQAEILQRALEKNTKLVNELNSTLTAELAARK